MNPSLASATSAGKILIHQPHSRGGINEGKKDVTFLNINKEITSIAGGSIDPDTEREILFVGSKTNLLAYDVNKNSDKFDQEVQDGVNCLLFTKIHSIPEPLIVTGGNCSLTGFDLHATEAFWTVTGDNVSALESVDIDFDGEPELVVGSDDFSIRVFRHEELIFDIKESSKIAFVSKIDRACFGFALSNN